MILIQRGGQLFSGETLLQQLQVLNLNKEHGAIVILHRVREGCFFIAHELS